MPHNHFFAGKHIPQMIRLHCKIALFLDFDGTLVPIRKDPARCFPADPVIRELRTLAGSPHYYVSVISGRTVPDLRRRIGIRNILYGGNHGFDIRGPGIRYMPSEASETARVLRAIKSLLTGKLARMNGVLLEDKKFGLTLHYRSLPDNEIAAIKKIFYETAAPFLEQGTVRVVKGKKVLELVPGISWDKGQAVLWILHQFNMECLPVYVGDDLTDETAFRALSGKGWTIRVGKSQKTSAHYYLKNHQEVLPFLRRIQKFNDNYS